MRHLGQEGAGLARRQCGQYRAHFARREIVPEAVAAGEEGVSEGEPIHVGKGQRGILLRTQAAGEQIGLRVRVGVRLGELARALDGLGELPLGGECAGLAFSTDGTRLVAATAGDDVPVAWLPREARYREKLATPEQNDAFENEIEMMENAD